jgi:uncharacterized protein involved in type VI secretion and phage assembly
VNPIAQLAALFDDRPGAPRVPAVIVGVVTNNQDPLHAARVKVRFPALSDTAESAWARVLTPVAGNGRGLQVLPEAGDAVLVAFENGEVDRPFVLGAFWAPPDAPPEAADPGNDRRTLRSRSGHVVRLDDTKGAERIEIVDGSGKNTIAIETATNKITVHAAGPVSITADGDLDLTAKGALTLHGQRVKVSADQTLELAGTAKAQLQSDGTTAVRGGTVQLN